MKKEEKTKAEQDMKELTEEELAGAAGGKRSTYVDPRKQTEEERLEDYRKSDALTKAGWT